MIYNIFLLHDIIEKKAYDFQLKINTINSISVAIPEHSP